MNKGKILIVDDENETCAIFSKILKSDGYWVFTALSANEAFTTVNSIQPDLIFLDVKLPDINGVEVLRKFKKDRLNSIIIMMTGYEDVGSAVESMKLGAYDYLIKPLTLDRLMIIVNHALEKKRMIEEMEGLKNIIQTQWNFNRIIGASKKIQELLQLARKITETDVTVFIRGETGTGKELIARAIHYEGPRKDKKFIPIDCASLPETLIESELFGYTKGAFTGANKDKPGKFEDASGGTIFLDEIGNLPINVQNKLLRVLQEKEVTRLGSKKIIDVDVRIITATNVNLESAVRKGSFKEDLYHRINVFPIIVPPLREREDDVILFSKYFMDRFSLELNKKIEKIDDEVLNIFRKYNWPGNVRELENVIKRAIILTEDKGIILPEHILDEIKNSVYKDKNLHETIAHPDGNKQGSLFKLSKDSKKLIERELIKKTLEETNWNKSETSRRLKISYKTLYNKYKEYDIKK